MFRGTWAEIDLNALTHNYKQLEADTRKHLFGVVKANAYGHGDVTVAKHLLSLGCEMLCVSSLDEAQHLVDAGIEADILIFSYVNPEAIMRYHRPQFIYTVSSFEWFTMIRDRRLSLRLHLEVNTGMNRYGIKDHDQLVAIISEQDVEGIYTHFQSPQVSPETQGQLDSFLETVASCDVNFKWVHVGNAAIDLIRDVSMINGARLGLGLYGYRHDGHDLRPVLSLYSKVTHLDTLSVGETIGYDYSYAAPEVMRFGTVPIGYADGFDVRNGSLPLWINGRAQAIIGKISMDQTMIAVSDDVNYGDRVEIVGPNRRCDAIAKATGIMIYIQLSCLSTRIERRYLK